MKKILLFATLLTLFSLAYAGGQQEEALSADVQASMHSAIVNPIQPHLVFSTPEKAEAWYQDMSKRLLRVAPKNPLVQDEFMRRRLLTLIQYEAVRAGLDVQMVLSLITVESKFYKYAISSADARGLMQVMPFWVRQIGTAEQDLFNIQTNVRYGCTILRYYLHKENGDMFMALGRYNGSRGKATYPDLVFGAYNRYWEPAVYTTIDAKGNLKSIDYTK
jgi:soluble lytic murein transglycosylase-like protein